ncbi:MAG: hypothetical protein DRO99_01360 [Candidatus Aenigmatarchaeota archaeon]|nr:MAG: hypothetical protein DRO99_01360 [Candidatus Aenigmarchaeota archaeon]
MKKVAIITGYTCNNNCRFCYDVNKRRKGIRDLTTDEVRERLVRARGRGCDYVDFLGGEFTIRKDALRLIRVAKELGFETIAVTTNGRMFAYEKVARDFIQAGMNAVIFSVHGHNEELHDHQTRVKGSFKQMMKGISNITTMGITLSTNTTITKLNYKHFPDIARFISNLGCRNAEFIFVDPSEFNKDEIRELVPRISVASPYIRNGLDIGIGKGVEHWHIRYVPLCMFRGYESNISELSTPFSTEEHDGPEFFNTDADASRRAIGRVKGPQCKRCKKDSICEGIWKAYADFYGTQELEPVE